MSWLVTVMNLLSAGAWFYVFTRSIRARDEIEKLVAKFPKEGDPYRTTVHLPVMKGPVYCEDCRFLGKGNTNKDICTARPTGKGTYFFVGLANTNEEYDCAHYQARDR